MLIGFHLLAGGFFAHRTNAQPDFLFLWIHLDDLEVVFLPRLKMNLLTVSVDRFGVMAEAFNAIGDLDEGAEACNPQDFAMQNVAYMVLLEECFPYIRLKLLDPER